MVISWHLNTVVFKYYGIEILCSQTGLELCKN
jgi:hypothetical protein